MRTMPRRTLAALATVTALLTLPASAGAVNIDTAPPGSDNQTTATFTVSPQGAFTNLWCSLDGGAATDCTSGIVTYPGLAEGAHSFMVTATDAGGMADPFPANHEWTIDLTAPDTALTEQPPASSTSSSATFQFTSTEAGTFECSLDAAAFSTCTSPVTYNALADGNHTFSVRAVDQATNQDTSPATVSWTITAPPPDTTPPDTTPPDTAPPDTAITSGPGGVNNVVQPRVEFTSSEGGSTFQCSLNGGPFAACSSPSILGALVDGAITFQVRAVDGAGNVDPSPASLSWTRDTAAPAAPAVAVGPRSGAFQTARKVRAQWPRVQDAASYDAEAALVPAGSDPAKGAWKPLQTNSTATQAETIVGAGSTGCVRVRATDAAGNDSAFAPSCTSVPYKVTSLSVIQRKGYLRLNLSADAVVKRVALVATKCRRCGRVRVVVTGDGAPPIAAKAASKTVSLEASKTQEGQLVPVATFASATPTTARRFVYVFTVGRAKLSRIEGIGVSPF